MSKEKYSSHVERTAELCHVCHQPFNDSDFAVHHSGSVTVMLKTRLEAAPYESRAARIVEGHGGITMHEECATILAMRLLHDVMQHRPHDDREDPRVVDTLRRTRQVLQHKGA